MATSSRKNNESNDYSVEEKIIALYELQKIDSKIDEINKIKGELPLEVQDLEDEIAGLETRIANITSEIDGLTASTKQRKEEIEQAKTLIAKYEHQQDNVRNNREFDSLSKEIEYQKLEIAQLEKDYKVAQARYSFGSITKSELESARQAVEKGRTTLNGLEDTLEENMDDMRDYLDLNEGVEFDLRDPPELGQYAVDFDEEEVLEGLTKNSLSLKQAQRNVDELNEKVQKYRDQGKNSKAEELADTGTSYDLALKEAKKSITSSVNSAFKNYRDLQTAMENAEAADEQANSDLLVTQLKFKMGTATQKELTAAELTYAQAEQALRQAEYDLYFGARRLALLSSGVTV